MDISSEISPINGQIIESIKLEGVCGCLLYIEGFVIKLFHSCRHGKGKRYKLSCPQCLAILETMRGNGNDYGKCIRDGSWRKLTVREITR